MVRFWAVAILCTIPPFAIGTFYVYICIFVEVDHTYGIKYFNVLCTGVTIAIGLVVATLHGSRFPLRRGRSVTSGRPCAVATARSGRPRARCSAVTAG